MEISISNLIVGFIAGAIIILIWGLLLNYKEEKKLKNEIDIPSDVLDVNNLKVNLSELKNESSNLKLKLVETEKTLVLNDSLISERKTFENQIELLNDEVKNLEKKYNKLKVEKSEVAVFEGLDNNSEETMLLKQIKNLKSNVDDLEDDINDLENKNKKIKKERHEIEEELGNVKNVALILSNEKELLEKELTIKIGQIEENDKSLSFINNILNAKNSTNSDYEHISQKTNNIYSFIKTEITSCFKECDVENAEQYEEYAWQWRNTQLKTWIKDKKIIAIVGEFSSGKTSIVNRILSQDNPDAILLPTSSKETTAVPTYIYRAKDESCQFYSPEYELKTISTKTFEQVTKSVLDKINVSPLIKYFVLSYDNEYLQDISILDTPGFASNSEDIIKRTTDVVKEADALFWIIDANTGDINQTSLNVMIEHLHGIPLYFVINKSDTKSPGDLALLEDKIRDTVEKNNVPYNAIVQFSSKENIDVIMKHIDKIPKSYGFNVISEITKNLDFLIKEIKKEKTGLLKNEKTIEENLSITEGNFKTITENITYFADEIRGLVRQKDTWLGLGDDKFEIEKYDYQNFVNNTVEISQQSQEIIDEVDFHSTFINQKIENDGFIEYYKYQTKKLLRVRDEFTRLIKDYNPNLLN